MVPILQPFYKSDSGRLCVVVGACPETHSQGHICRDRNESRCRSYPYYVLLFHNTPHDQTQSNIRAVEDNCSVCHELSQTHSQKGLWLQKTRKQIMCTNSSAREFKFQKACGLDRREQSNSCALCGSLTEH